MTDEWMELLSYNDKMRAMKLRRLLDKKTTYLGWLQDRLAETGQQIADTSRDLARLKAKATGIDIANEIAATTIGVELAWKEQTPIPVEFHDEDAYRETGRKTAGTSSGSSKS